MSLTSEEVISLFEKYCDEFGKFLIPDPRQDGIVENLIKYYNRFYDEDLLEQTIKYFVRHSGDDAILIFDFAIESGKMREKALDDRKDREEIDGLMKATQERMKRFQ